MTGRIVLAATPIGDVEDASPRLRGLLETAEVIAAEDTRRLHALAQRMGVRPTGRVVSHHEHNEASRVEQLLAVVRDGGTVLVVSDAGMPTVSDPGFTLVRAAIEAGLPVTTAPGPSAVLAALAVSGLPTDRFCFEGFLPRKAGDRRTVLTGLAGERRTMVFFESPHRVAESLEQLAEVFGPDRQAAVCRELTKTYEQVVRGRLDLLAGWARDAEPRGEICLVVGGVEASTPVVEDLVGEVLARVDQGERLKTVAAEIARASGVATRDLYAAALLRRGR